MSSANIGPLQVNKKVIQKADQQPQQLQDEEPNWDLEGIDPFSSSVQEMPSEVYRDRFCSNRRQRCSSSELHIAISEDPGQCRSYGVCKRGLS